MKHRHDKIAKEDRPVEGQTYDVLLDGRPIFEAEVTDYKGGCWAHLKVNKAFDSEYASLYSPGDEFQTKIAAYKFRPTSDIV
ncbi:hypothetical protein MASR2M18_07000 [Ignavibacteria bacterium]|nr:hypothetical protein [Bacteroidota bacterium]